MRCRSHHHPRAICRPRPRPSRIAGLVSALAIGLTLLASTGSAGAVELCWELLRRAATHRVSAGIGYMRAAGISEARIRRVCELASRRSGVLALDTQRLETELGYCRVTLSLRNNSQQYLNAMTITSEQSRFEIFRFSNILPGDVGYASARSRILMACDELPQIKLRLHWPVSLRMGDRPVQGARLAPYKPILLSEVMEWTR